MTTEWLHFVGVAGSGMSGLAQYHSIRGGRATGSDRAFDQGLHSSIRRRLEAVGVQIVPQDGSAIDPQMDAVIASTAVEASIPDLIVATDLGLAIRHRSELLADYVAASRTIAISGTSGKSTVTAMLFELLHHCGQSPSILTGGDLRMLQEEGRIGNAWVGESDLLVIEADESDGSLVRYRPWAGVLLNLQRDHKETHELEAMFHTFRERTSGPFFVGSDQNLDPFASAPSYRFGAPDPTSDSERDSGLDFGARDIALGPESSRFRMTWPESSKNSQDAPEFHLPVPGLHNVSNATAALAVGYGLGLSPNQMRDALNKFAGVSRRFQKIASPRGIEVIDDFGHNPKKIEATLRTARIRIAASEPSAGGEPAGRILAVFQPHGFRPTAFIRDELVETLARELRSGDHFWFLDIFYAGGTVDRSIAASDIVADLEERGSPVSYAESRTALIEAIVREAKPRDQVLVLGARDPSLTELARQIARALE